MSASNVRVVVLGGDGIGPAVTDAAIQVADRALDEVGATVRIDWDERPFGATAHFEYGTCFPDATRDALRGADAVLLGAVGDPRADGLSPTERPEAALLALRARLGVWANVRPVRVPEALAALSPLRPERLRGTDIEIVRELGSGIYFGEPRHEGDDVASDTMVYRRKEVERVVRFACRRARERRGHVVSVDKANVLASSRLWRRTAERIAAAFPDVTFEHRYVDAFAAEMILEPARFDVVVTGNLFGDILADEFAVLSGSLGVLGSGSYGSGPSLFEPIHGSAPDIAGSGLANPVGAMLSAAMLLRDVAGSPEAATCVERAVDAALRDGVRTPDLAPDGGGVGTAAFTEAVLLRTAGDESVLARSSWTFG